MPNLPSPGVDVSIIDESVYNGADRGTIPCIFIATHTDKVHPSGQGIAAGTAPEKANTLYLMTSQREAIQTFGDPVFYQNNGTPVHGHELNEYGLHALYQYLGIANRAYVIRADIDLGQLQPSSVSPRGLPVNGTYWFDLNDSKMGLFESNGHRNPGLAWDSKELLLVDTENKAYTVVLGNTDTAINNHATQSVLSSAGVLNINGVDVNLNSGDSLLSIVSKINTASIDGITAGMVAVSDIVDDSGNTNTPDNVDGVRYNLKLVHTRAKDIVISGDVAVITQLGLDNYEQDVMPSMEMGNEGDYAMITFRNDNRVYQKLTPEDAQGIAVNTPDVGAHWYYVGSGAWKAATPTIVSSKVVTSTFSAGYIEFATENGNVQITIDAGDTVSVIRNKINNNADLVAERIIARSTGTQLIVANVDGKDIQFTDQGGNALDTLGIDATIYLGNKSSFSTHAIVPNPSATGDVWMKTTKPNKGAEWAIKRYDSSVGQWRSETASMFGSDEDAIAGLGTQLAAGSIYVQTDTENNGTVSHTIRRWNGANWEPLSYEASYAEPTSEPVNGTLWYNNDLRADIMVSNGTQWFGYRNRYPGTDIILSGSEPLNKPSGGSLIDNDLWIDSSDLENYPRIYRYLGGAWDIIDTTDQTTPFGIIFADARQDNGSGNEDYDAMLMSNDVDGDAPDAYSYPDGLLMFNTRYSTYNVKRWTVKHSHEGVYIGNRWVTVSGNDIDGSPFMGRKAQRQMIVRAMAAAIVDNEDLRSEQVYFNLMAAPGYTEVTDEMVSLNVDKKQWAFITGDTPARLKPNATEVQNWAQNAELAGSNGEKGLTTANPYVGLYYPWGLSTNIDGQEVMVPPSTIALRTLAYNDSVAYPWLAPAGFNRGLVTNATTTGYLTDEGEFKPVLLNQGQRDVLYLNNINPIAFIPNRGLVIHGQKTLSPVDSAMDRINVARLTNYLRYQLEMLAKPFLFEPNDLQTRDSVRITFERFMSDLVGLRAMYDFLIVCDETNNTNERIDRNELWIDVAIQPVKAVEFIYIPIRILNTGEEFG